MFYTTIFKGWKWYQCFDALFRSYSRLHYTTHNVKVRIEISLVMLSHSYSFTLSGLLWKIIFCPPKHCRSHVYVYRSRTTQCQRADISASDAAGRFMVWMSFLFNFILSFFSEEAKAMAKVNPRVTRWPHNDWCSVKRSYSVTCREEAEVCHIQSDGGIRASIWLPELSIRSVLVVVLKRGAPRWT